MTNMFGRPDEPISEAIYASPYQAAPSVVIAFPSFADWFRLYDPQKSRGYRWNRDMYEDFKRNHERSVKKELDLISKKSTGQAVLAEMNARSAFSVMILPFDFLPTADWSVHLGALTKATERRKEWAQGVPICGATMAGKHFCIAAKGEGGGSSVDIYFTPRRHRGRESADEVLLHELLHATRKVRGVLYRMPMTGGYGNQEEFLAVLVANMYRSEKKSTDLFNYHGGSIDAAKFLDSNLSPPIRTVIAGLRTAQPSLYAALARVQATFNPVRQVDVEYNALMKRIERV
jgi:hypothetical protein